ncbi:hypothetical protein [Billgrantia lactosivorans]|uniref:hypothetical protein n=1 Tax=Billgrantia lactosivorans TaxID=2185141 RepID=UPI0013A6DBE2|nr:hypothetical protein [Halomonas lactosivorans]
MTTLRFSTIWDVSTSRARHDEPGANGRYLTIWDSALPRRRKRRSQARPARTLPRFYL